MGVPGDYIRPKVSRSPDQAIRFELLTRDRIESGVQEMVVRMLPVWCVSAHPARLVAVARRHRSWLRRPGRARARIPSSVSDPLRARLGRFPLSFPCSDRLCPPPDPCSEYAAVVQRFVEVRSTPGWGRCSQGLAGALRALIQDWHLMVAQLETQMLQGKLTLQALWYYVQPPATALREAAEVCCLLSNKGLRGAHLLDLLNERASASIGDARARALLRRLLAAAAEPYFQTLRRWLAEGVLDDPAREFFVAEDQVRTGGGKKAQRLVHRWQSAAEGWTGACAGTLGGGFALWAKLQTTTVGSSIGSGRRRIPVVVTLAVARSCLLSTLFCLKVRDLIILRASSLFLPSTVPCRRRFKWKTLRRTARQRFGSRAGPCGWPQIPLVDPPARQTSRFPPFCDPSPVRYWTLDVISTSYAPANARLLG